MDENNCFGCAIARLPQRQNKKKSFTSHYLKMNNFL